MNGRRSVLDFISLEAVQQRWRRIELPWVCPVASFLESMGQLSYASPNPSSSRSAFTGGTGQQLARFRFVYGSIVVACPRVLATALVLVVLPLEAGASTAADTFETGLDGWESYLAYRTETNVLDGDYAVYGYDGSELRKVFELTGTEVLAMSVYFTGSDPELSPRFVAVVARRLNSSGTPVGDFAVVGTGESILATDQNPMPNPDRRRYDLSSLIGLHQVRIIWPQLACIPEDPFECFDTHFVGFIDTVTVPEPSSSLLGAISLSVALLLARRGFERRRQNE